MERLSLRRGDTRRVAALVVLALAALIAIVSARDYAGGWNDGSRLATVESLVDRHTLAIDDSIFVRVPPAHESQASGPYPADEPGLLQRGTLDKLFIDGHFYSDKSPVPAVLMAILYQVLQWGAGLHARLDPGRFVYWMTIGASALAYVIAVWSVFQLGAPLRLPLHLRLSLTASFGLATLAPVYARHVNNHIVLLGVAAALLLGFARLARESQAGSVAGWRLLGLGTLAGLGYTIDLGAGPLLMISALTLVAVRRPGLRAPTIFLLGALPWLVLHHTLNYAIGGTFRPANAVPEYLMWPGSPFTPGDMTGSWSHESVGHFVAYALAMLFGKRGFFGHNLPLFLTLPAVVTLLRRRAPEHLEILAGLGWAAGTWLLYAATSTNSSGVAASIRWFLPLLAPAYYLLAVFLREHPKHRMDFLVLGGWGIVLTSLIWWAGPWMKRMAPFFWPLQAAALLTWLLMWAWRRREEQKRVEAG
ncbi:MAG: hypothetical protein ACE5Q3_09375 [Alphaproteobacteria bacterium]